MTSSSSPTLSSILPIGVAASKRLFYVRAILIKSFLAFNASFLVSFANPGTIRSTLSITQKVMMISEFSSDSQWIAYFVVTVVVLAMVYCFLKQLTDNAEAEQEPTGHQEQGERHHETEPILPRKEVFVSYGSTEEQPESSVNLAEDSSSEKMCKICYDEPRNCFLVPCGHCVTCFTCAKRIVEEENKACPICRRLIHRVRAHKKIQREED